MKEFNGGKKKVVKDCYHETKQSSEKWINDQILSILFLMYVSTVENEDYDAFISNQLFSTLSFPTSTVHDSTWINCYFIKPTQNTTIMALCAKEFLFFFVNYRLCIIWVFPVSFFFKLVGNFLEQLYVYKKTELTVESSHKPSQLPPSHTLYYYCLVSVYYNWWVNTDTLLLTKAYNIHESTQHCTLYRLQKNL